MNHLSSKQTYGNNVSALKIWVCFLSLFFLANTACCKDKACGNKHTTSPLAKVVFHTPQMNDVEVLAEVAQTTEERTQGLMGRKHLAPNRGMLFIFPYEGEQIFWMKNTFIELDMIFIRANLTVLGCLERAEPLTTTPRSVEGLAKYVLEVNGGFCEKHHISQASTVEIFIDGERL